MLALVLLMGSALANEAMAACTSIPNSFTNGNVADAGQVNANFSYLGSCAASLASPSFMGTVGIGMTASNVLDITQTQNAISRGQIYNNSGTTAAGAEWKLLNNNSSIAILRLYGGSYTTSGIDRQDGALLSASGAGGLTLATSASQPIYFAVASAERARFGTDGSFLVGGTTNAGAGSIAASGNLYAGGYFSPGVASHRAAMTFDGQNVNGLVLNDTNNTSAAGASILLWRNGNSMGYLGTNNTDALWAATTAARVISGGSGGVVLASGATSWSAISDERLKSWSPEQTDYRRAIRTLEIGDYRWKKDGRPDFGAKAQQLYGALEGTPLREVFVKKPKIANDNWTVASDYYGKLALWGVKDIYTEVESLERRNAERDRLVSDLRNENRVLTRQIRDLMTAVATLERVNGQRFDKHVDAVRARTAR
jgi:hypothetical protein